MKRNARNAFNALKKIEAPVYDHITDNGCEFIIGAELRNSDDEYFCDYYGYSFEEHLDKKGNIVNAFGIREDVWKILKKYELTAEWFNPAQVGVYS